MKISETESLEVLAVGIAAIVIFGWMASDAGYKRGIVEGINSSQCIVQNNILPPVDCSSRVFSDAKVLCTSTGGVWVCNSDQVYCHR